MNDSRPSPAWRASRLRSRGDSELGSDSVMGPSDPAMTMSEAPRTSQRRRLVLAATVSGTRSPARDTPSTIATRCAGASLLDDPSRPGDQEGCRLITTVADRAGTGGRAAGAVSAAVGDRDRAG